MGTVCGTVIALNEELNIDRCLQSLQWADNLLVLVDSRTTDGTVSRASLHGARVEVRPFVDYARQRNAALQLADAEWVLFVDADEVVPPELAEEVRTVSKWSGQAAPGYWIPRRNILFGRWVRHAGWSPDPQLRLLRRGHANFREDRGVHELADLSGEAGHLTNPLIHYNYATWKQFLAKQRVYAAMEAADMRRRGVRIKVRNYLLQPLRQFWRRYVTLEGFREGSLGLILSTLLAYYELRTYLDLRKEWDLGEQRSTDRADLGGPL